MQQVIYISTARKALEPGELDAILATSRRKNAAVGVTGLLVMGGRRFLQALEGPDHAVASVFRRIERDDRHFAVVELSRGPILERTFGDWSMGYRAGGASVRGDISLPEIMTHLLAPLEDPVIRGYFEGFLKFHAAA